MTISAFKGKTYVGLREYYEKDGKVSPHCVNGVFVLGD